MKSKKNIILLSGIILTLVLTLSISYAFFYYVEEGDEITLTSGSISIDFNEGTNYISLGNSYPKSDIMGKIDPNYYDFTVSGSKGENDDILYEIQIEEEEGNTLDEKYVKVYLETLEGIVLNEPIALISLPNSEYNSNKIMHVGYINELNQTKNYRLRVWIDESYSENVSKAFNFKVNLYSVNGKVEFIYDRIAKLNGTNGVVAINTNGDLASDGDAIREYRYSGNARYCTYTYNSGTYYLNVDSEKCPTACHKSGFSLFRYDNESISVMGENCDTEVISNENIPIDGDVKNYVWYNNEMWRIIGAFSTEIKNGIAKKMVKLMRDEPLLQEEVPNSYTYNGVQMKMKYTNSPYSNLKYANMYWNAAKYFNQVNWNDWTKASLQYYLNDETKGASSYYNRIQTTYKQMIEKVVHYIGNVTVGVGSNQKFYLAERGENIFDGNEKIWIGKIGMLYPSDRLYAGSGTIAKGNWVDDDVSKSEWFISPSHYFGDRAMNINYKCQLSFDIVTNSTATSAVSPTLYLKSNIRILSGDGSYNNPYQIGW